MDLIINDNSTGNPVTAGSVVLIDAEANMPPLVCTLAGTTDPTATWAVSIGYSRNGRNDLDTFPVNGPVQAPSNTAWDYLQALNGAVRGGDITIRAVCGNDVAELSFEIRGTNPSNDRVLQEIAVQTTLWYAPYIARRESREVQMPAGQGELHQFFESGTYADTKGTPHASPDFGFGLFQLTNIFNRVPTPDELWSWKANIATGTRWLQALAGQADKWMNGDTDAGDSKDGQRVQARKQTGSNVPVPDEVVGNVTFSDGTACIIEQAVAIKMFNGAASNYCYWDKGAAAWGFNRTNDTDGRDYVADVCSEVAGKYP